MSAPATFATVRRRRTAHFLAQGLLVLTLIAGLNYLATQHAWRFDLSRHARHSLSPETRSYLRDLPADVKVVVTLTDSDENDQVAQAYRDVRVLLRDYVEAASTNEKARLEIEFVDVYQNRVAAQRLGITEPNSIVVISGERRRSVALTELYAMRSREKSAFVGERAFTSAILDVTRGEPQRIVFLAGHGEMDLTDTDPARGLSLLRDELTHRNFQLEVADLSSPADRDRAASAALMVIASPQGRFSRDEQEFLRRHLASSAGRVLAFLNPGYPHGLDELLDDWGVLADDVVIFDQSAEGRSDTGDLILFPAASGHPAVDFLASNRISLRFGPTRSIRPDPARTDPSLKPLPLVVASPKAWGERSYRQRGVPTFDPETDLPAPLAGGTASERVAPKGKLPFSVRGGRIAVFGGGEWVGNSRLAAGGNLSLALASINWLVDRDTQLQIPARPIETFQLTLASDQLGRLRLALVFGLPAVAAGLGLLVYWARRR